MNGTQKLSQAGKDNGVQIFRVVGVICLNKDNEIHGMNIMHDIVPFNIFDRLCNMYIVHVDIVIKSNFRYLVQPYFLCMCWTRQEIQDNKDQFRSL